MSGVLGDDDGRNLRTRERVRDIVGRRGADDDGSAALVRIREGLRVGDIPEHERFGQWHTRVAFDRDLRHAAPRRAEPALPHVRSPREQLMAADGETRGEALQPLAGHEM